MAIKPVHIDVFFTPLTPDQDADRRKIFLDEEYIPHFDDEFEDVAQELIDLSVRLLRLLPDPSLGPDERLERLARIVPASQMITAHRRTARSKLYQLQRRLGELVPDPGLDSRGRLDWLVERLEALVPGEGLRPIERLERVGDFRSTDVGISTRRYQ
ncbi:hypothetical protein ACIRL0_16820 [Streptomyces sp. NPDC102365]|uniref:hypothetical protein n=1 Tax=Streptomyces sp. NPDC102365 TaxID=3366162 RepID=UPI00381DB9A5